MPAFAGHTTADASGGWWHRQHRRVRSIAGRGPQTTNARNRRSARVHRDNRAEHEVDGRALAGLSAEPKGRRRSSIAATSRPRDPGHEAPTASRPPGSGQNWHSAHAQWPARSPGIAPRAGRARRRVRPSDKLPLIALSLVMLLTACGGRGNALAGPDPGGGYPFANNTFDDCANL